MQLLEARDRIGGRIHAVMAATGGFPIELGAEFVHGERNDTWELIRAAGLQTEEVPDRHWRLARETLTEDTQFWEQLEAVLGRIDPAEPDQDFQGFLRQQKSLEARAKKSATAFVQGFHAADDDRISIHSLAKAEQASERAGGNRQFRITRGYRALLDWLAGELERYEARVHCGTVAHILSWQPGAVEVVATTSAGTRKFRGRCALITLPLGVLQQEEGLRYEPRLTEKLPSIRALAMGQVLKVALQFKTRFWPVQNFGFIHAEDAPLPTWWSDARGPIVTGWAGGPQASALSGEGQPSIEAEALRSLARLFKLDVERIRGSLVASYTYDWERDPFARGAYSYTPVGMTGMPARLSAPVAGTLFFAGEATDTTGAQGTVHGALASGKRAAREILDSLNVHARLCTAVVSAGCEPRKGS